MGAIYAREMMWNSVSGFVFTKGLALYPKTVE